MYGARCGPAQPRLERLDAKELLHGLPLPLLLLLLLLELLRCPVRQRGLVGDLLEQRCELGCRVASNLPLRLLLRHPLLRGMLRESLRARRRCSRLLRMRTLLLPLRAMPRRPSTIAAAARLVDTFDPKSQLRHCSPCIWRHAFTAPGITSCPRGFPTARAWLARAITGAASRRFCRRSRRRFLRHEKGGTRLLLLSALL